MRETYLTVAGVVATDPTMRTLDDGRNVMSFRMASTSRRYDTATKTWVDGHTLWVKVSCWRQLAENASKSVRRKDRVLVSGRIRSEQWVGQNGQLRSDLALEAEAMGHDLTYGTAIFDRKSVVVGQQVLTGPTSVDPATGEIVSVAAEVAPVPDGVAALVDTPFSQPAFGPVGGRPQGGSDDDADELDELDDDTDDDLDEYDDDVDAEMRGKGVPGELVRSA